jgi:hypothetical protein
MRTAVVPALAFALASASPAAALTAEEVLKLREAGVSDETIQQMLANERAQADQQGATEQMQQQKFANDNIGTWNTSDGRVVLSTGRADPDKDVFDPTVPQENPYPMSIYPYVFPNAGPGAPAPVIGPHGLPGPGPR